MAIYWLYEVKIRYLWQINIMHIMSPYVILLTIASYVLLLSLLGYLSGRRTDNMGFFLGGRTIAWWKATLAMIGAAMSGVTFVSVPGAVAADGMSYMQMVVGFTIGQFIVAFVLIPQFYNHGIVSLYEWLGIRFGKVAHRTGAWCFLLAKLIGAALKVFVVCSVLQLVVFDYFELHFIYNVVFTMFLVWLFTHSGGVRTLIVTDMVQSFCLVASVVVIIVYLCHAMGLDAKQAIDVVAQSPYSQMWFFDNPSSSRYFWKMVAGGALCLVAMTGLDQDMMQRNLSCRTKRDSQINIVLTAICQIGVILLLLTLGVLIYAYINYANIAMPLNGDEAFPLVAISGGLSFVVGVMFVLGLVSSTYSAAGASLTSLTTSFVVDVLDGINCYSEGRLKQIRNIVHGVMALIMTLMIVVAHYWGEGSVINLVFKIAGYTYGPILGLFVFGIASKREIYGKYLPLVVAVAPCLSYLVQWYMDSYMRYEIGFELLGYNALFTIFGLYLISYDVKKSKTSQ